MFYEVHNEHTKITPMPMPLQLIEGKRRREDLGPRVVTTAFKSEDDIEDVAVIDDSAWQHASQHSPPRSRVSRPQSGLGPRVVTTAFKSEDDIEDVAVIDDSAWQHASQHSPPRSRVSRPQSGLWEAFQPGNPPFGPSVAVTADQPPDLPSSSHASCCHVLTVPGKSSASGISSLSALH